MNAVADDLVGPRRSEFRRLLAISLGCHLGGVLLLAWAPTGFYSAAAPPQVIAVDVVMEAPSAPKARPAPPPAPIPVKKKVVLPKEPTLPKPEAKPKPKPKRRELAPSDLEQPPEPAEQDLEDVLAQLRAEQGEPDPAQAAPPQPVQSAAVAPSPGARGGNLSPEVAAWMRKAKLHVRRAWILPPGFRTQPLETRLAVRLDANGAVLGEPEIVRRSGNPWYDEGVVRAIRKASPLPPPPEAGEWKFVFVPEDSY